VGLDLGIKIRKSGFVSQEREESVFYCLSKDQYTLKKQITKDLKKR
jgi:hypothetical protein